MYKCVFGWWFHINPLEQTEQTSVKIAIWAHIYI